MTLAGGLSISIVNLRGREELEGGEDSSVEVIFVGLAAAG